MKIKLMIVWVTLLISTAHAQDDSATPPPFPGGLAIQTRAPDFSEWVITTTAGDLSDNGSSSQSTDTPAAKSTSLCNQDTVTKTHKVIRVVRLDPAQRVWTVWCNGSQEVMVWPDGKSCEQLTPAQEHAPQNPFYMEFGSSDFSGFSWVSSKNYTGIIVYQGTKCIVYEASANLDSDKDAKKTHVKAYVDLTSRLPIAMESNGFVYHYKWNPAPESVLAFPSDVQSVISAVSRVHKQMAQLASAPF